MRFDEVSQLLHGIPHIGPRRGRQLYDFVRNERPQQILELGFAHGTSTCYLAAALEENGSGSVTTVDVIGSRGRDPNLEHLLERTGLGDRVVFHREETSYTWYLKRLIEDRTDEGAAEPLFDFCFVDGAHTWDVDGFAFFLVDKLLLDGGWLLFDDLDWRLGDTRPDLPAEQREEAQVARVFELLVMQHPDYGQFRIDDTWGWARRQPGGERSLAIEPIGVLRGLARGILRRSRTRR